MLDRALLSALQRQHMSPFIDSAFRELHPGTPFIPNWHIEALSKALEDVYEGRNRRLLVTMPPRYLKSICTSVGFCAWALGKDPSLKIMSASYGEQLSKEHMHSFRRLISSEWYRDLFQRMRIDPGANRANEIKTTGGGGRLAIARGGAATGFGADIIIVDDLLKADEGSSETARASAHEFFTGTLLSRLNDKSDGRIIVIQQRLHEDDLAGRLISAGGYVHLNLPAIAETPETFDLGFGLTYHRAPGDILFPERESRDTLDQLRAEMGVFQFNAQYQQNPTPPDGGIIRWDWFETYGTRPPREQFQQVIQSWDTGMSADPQSDFSVCLTLGYRDRAWWLLDVFRRRLDFPDLVKAARRLQNDWNADRVVIEKLGSGISLLQELRLKAERRSTFVSFKPKQDKEERLRGQTAKLADGLVRLPATSDWLAPFKHELNGFPNARHDDQVDALSQFLEHISRRGGAFLHPGETKRRKRSRRH